MNTKKNIPYSLALRVKKICDRQTDQERRFRLLAKHLAGLGYPAAIMMDAIHRAQERNQSELRLENQVDSTETKTILPFVHTFNP